MTIVYAEFDSTVANVAADIAAKILTHPDWADITPPVQPPVTLTASVATSTTAWPVGAAGVAGLYVGQTVEVTVGGMTYGRQIVDIAATTFTVNVAAGITIPTGTQVTFPSKILKATTTRGAGMIIDLFAGREANCIAYTTYRSHTGASTTSFTDANPPRYLFWRSAATSVLPTHVVHVTLSVSKEHLFIAVEGPRGWEPGATSVTYGCCKNYLFLCDVVPYHAEDTVPCIFAHGSITRAASATMAGLSYLGSVSRNSTDDESWSATRLGTIAFPVYNEDVSVGLNRTCTIDGNTYLWPYLVVSEDEGLRGRLARLFNAGNAIVNSIGDYGSPVGQTVTYDGIVYKLVAVNKSEGSSPDYWGALGQASNSSTTTAYQSVVVAVPFAEAV